MNLKYLILFVAVIMCGACKKVNPSTSSESVMCDQMAIVASRGNETLSIKANGLLNRTYRAGELEVTVDLIPRSERWYGSLGLYKPSGTADIHLVAEEGQQHFASVEDALNWFEWHRDRFRYIHTSNGLVVGWYAESGKDVGPKKALSVQVWQIYIDGEKPVSLPGAADNAIELSWPSNSEGTCGSVGDFTPQVARVIEGRLYSGKALDIMEELEIEAEDVEQAIANSEPQHKSGYTDYFYDPPGDKRLFRVRLGEDGNVVLIR